MIVVPSFFCLNGVGMFQQRGTNGVTFQNLKVYRKSLPKNKDLRAFSRQFVVTNVAQPSAGLNQIRNVSFQQVIEDSIPINSDLRVSNQEENLQDITLAKISKDKMKEEKEKRKLEKKAKKEERKMQKMKMEKECEEDSDSDSDSEDEDEGCMDNKKMEKEKMKMKKKECKNDKEKKQKKQMKMKKEEDEECNEKNEKKDKIQMEKQKMEEDQNTVDQATFDRQQQLFDKVVTMWEEDRKSWTDREKILLGQIKLLQQLVGNSQTSSPTSQEHITKEIIEQNNSSQQQDFVSEVERAMTQRTKDDGTQRMGDTMSVKIPNTAEELAKAMEMVKTTDVMEDLKEFMSMPKRGASQKIQQNKQDQVSPPQTVTTDDDKIAAPQVKETPSGPPPTLCLGDDDIFWVNQLQAALLEKGYYCGEDEMEDWYFGDQTQNALLTFQACAQIPETGTVDEATWKALLGDDMKPIVPEQDSATSSIRLEHDMQGQGHGAKEAVLATTIDLKPQESESKQVSKSSKNGVSGWPVLMEGDGGKETHALQVVLGRKGYYCGGEDVEWWQFGSTTLEAMKTFQACSSLPVSGVCDETCWKALLGDMAMPADIYDIQAGDASDDDMSDQDNRIWLMGEQRWSDPSRLSSASSADV
eukprot:TRINITY_DN1541_c0_g2_i3.p2 TRINITY_DN1541_c0_g2~~TRINITY_DN1541_c0_g2_i3.p2  ORF type:complete len:641 (-),score=117.30 TRINITY_DN1541_c0_g2_i3:455-2377(-)